MVMVLPFVVFRKHFMVVVVALVFVVVLVLLVLFCLLLSSQKETPPCSYRRSHNISHRWIDVQSVRSRVESYRTCGTHLTCTSMYSVLYLTGEKGGSQPIHKKTCTIWKPRPPL